MSACLYEIVFNVLFGMFEGADYEYGQLIISDGANKPYYFRMEGTGANINSRTFFAGEITVTGTKAVKYITVHAWVLT